VGTWSGTPFDPAHTTTGRTDEGVDFTSSSPYMAVAPGRVVHIDPNFYNGTAAVYIRLDKPVSVNGRTYDGLYYAETSPMVRVGQHVTPGQDVIGPGNAEIGFARRFGKSDASWLPAAHGVYHEGDPTQAGQDFLSTVGSGGGGSFWSNLYHGSGASTVVGVVTGTAGAVTGTVSTVEAVGGFLGKLTDPHFILRGMEIVGGALIALLGLYLLAKQAGLGEGAPQVPVVRELAPPAARAAGAVRQRRRTRHRRQAEAQVGPSELGPKRKQELSEAGERRQAVRERASRAEPSNEIPF